MDALKQSGLYGRTRNPQVVAFMGAMIGYGLLWPTWPHAGSLLLLAAVAHWMVLTEEEHLRDAFGEAYEGYCRRVPRYMGFGKRERRDQL